MRYLIVFSFIFFIACKKNQVEDNEIVKFHYKELLGKYLVSYQLIVMHNSYNIPNQILNFQDTFTFKLSNDQSRLEWRSITNNKAFEFDAEINKIILESSGFKIAKLPIFADKVTYKGSYDTITLNKTWVLYSINNYDECAVFVKKNNEIYLQGPDVDVSKFKAHLAASNYRRFFSLRYLRFKILNSKKIE
jgi:hypothetical protein